MSKDATSGSTDKRQKADEPSFDNATVLNPVIGLSTEDLVRTASGLLARSMTRPAAGIEQSARLWQDWVRVLLNQSDLEADARDRRFAAPEWQERRAYKQALQRWLAWRDSLDGWVEGVGFEEADAKKAHFFVELLSDAFAPTNFLFGNPGALAKARETRGRSLVDGFRNYLDDLIHNQGMPSQVDKTKFKVGENIANTPGAVVFRNEIAELIQYQPTTAKVRAKPLFIVPPQINKYYIYDMSAEKSFVAHALDQGLQAFVVSWRNPTADHRDWGLDDYVATVEEAIDATLEITGRRSVNGVGACAGGITFAAALGYMAAAKKNKVSSITLMVNVLDNDPDDSVVNLFATDRTIEAARKRSAAKGVLEGDSTARVFNWMRPNDLIWNYVVSNYLHGQKPPAFDILFWNSDTTNLPAKLHSDFLDIFKRSPFRNPGDLTVLGHPIDLEQVTCDAYVTGGTTDHITPWNACYRTTQLLGGDVTYVLSTAGHIQSIVNPTKGSKRKYFLNPETPEDHEEWLAAATQHDGSWWTHWYGWVKKRAGASVAAPKALGSEKHPVLCDAPGTYVLETS